MSSGCKTVSTANITKSTNNCSISETLVSSNLSTNTQNDPHYYKSPSIYNDYEYEDYAGVFD